MLYAKVHATFPAFFFVVLWCRVSFGVGLSGLLHPSGETHSAVQDDLICNAVLADGSVSGGRVFIVFSLRACLVWRCG